MLMDVSYPGDRAKRDAAVRAEHTAFTASDDAVTGSVANWTRGLGLISVVFSIVAVGSTTLMVFHLFDHPFLRPAAVIFATLALGAGVASVVARQLHSIMSSRIDLMSQALEASANAHLILAPDGAMAHANKAFHKFFPGLAGSPIAALTTRAGRSGYAIDLAALRDTARRDGN